MTFALPSFASTEDAVRFGVTITRDEYLFLLGARAALQGEFDEIRSVAGTQQLQADLALKMQLIRECLEAAPDLVLCSLLDSPVAAFLQS
jgi:hypothetical protein